MGVHSEVKPKFYRYVNRNTRKNTNFNMVREIENTISLNIFKSSQQIIHIHIGLVTTILSLINSKYSESN